jgi:hypothetical protein
MRLRRPSPIGREHLPEQEPAQWQRLTGHVGAGHGQTWISFGYGTPQPWYSGPYRQDVPKRGNWVHGR